MPHHGPDTARSQTVLVTATQITADDRASMNAFVPTLIETGAFAPAGFAGEASRAMPGCRVAG